MQDEPRDAGTEEPRERSRERKQRILHTRISEQLADDIRAIADDLRVPVSNLVRNVLEEAFSAVERVSGDVGELIDDVIEEAEVASERYRRYRDRVRDRARERAQERAATEGVRETEETPEYRSAADVAEPDALARVVAWQPVVLAAERRCARTGRTLRPGERAYLGLGDAGPLGVYVAEDALDAPPA
ncbi:MAG: hypothetical protein ABFS41_18570, partial [Myxococcota bacterium]